MGVFHIDDLPGQGGSTGNPQACIETDRLATQRHLRPQLTLFPIQ